ncbi:hypothetical protein BCR34DRAFT_462614, partial [Clohesyomyces aquaticus]
MTSKAHVNCSNCGEPALRKCTKCYVHVYCNKKCQSTNWDLHKTVCQKIRQDTWLEKIVERTAILTKELYLAFRQETYDRKVVKIEENQGKIIVHDDDRYSLRKGGCFVDFPHNLVKTQNMKDAITCTLVRQDGSGYFHGLIQQMIRGLGLCVEEVEVALRDPRPMQIIYSGRPLTQYNTSYTHFVLRLKSASGATWAIDITGGQYGIHRAFWDWADYEEKNIELIKTVLDFGKNKQFIEASSKLQGEGGMLYAIGLQAMVHAEKAVKKWEQGSRKELSMILAEPEPEFNRLKEEVVKIVRQAVKKFVSGADYTKPMEEARRHDAKNP